MSKRQKIAAHNRDELLNAAEECFRIYGINVPLQVVIDHAGVGRA
ncbi:TetR/AcrR family transcriptional regulator, partial [Acinetobacter baumannii]